MTISETDYLLSDFGARGDGIHDDTPAFVEALDRIRHAGGGRLILPGGNLTYMISPIHLISNLVLYIKRGATIQGIADESKWPLIPPVPSYGQGRDHPGPRYMSLLQGIGLENVRIQGDGIESVLDGNGNPYWYQMRHEQRDKYTRGHLVEFMYSRNIVVQNLSMKDSPFWFNHIFDCDDVVFREVHIASPKDSPNTDGFDPDSSRNVLIEDSTYSGGDDCVAIKSGWDCYGLDYNKPSINITIRNVTCEGFHNGGIAIGSEMSGGVENVMISNVTFQNSVGRALIIKPAKPRGGYVRNITYRDIRFEGTITREAFFIDMLRFSRNDGRNPSCPEKWLPPSLSKISDLTFMNIDAMQTVIEGNETFHFQAFESSPIENVYLENIHFPTPTHGVAWNCTGVSGTAKNKSIEPWPPCDGFEIVDEASLGKPFQGTSMWSIFHNGSLLETAPLIGGFLIAFLKGYHWWKNH